MIEAERVADLVANDAADDACGSSAARAVVVRDVDARARDPEVARLHALGDADALALLGGSARVQRMRDVGRRGVVDEREAQREAGVAPLVEDVRAMLRVARIPAGDRRRRLDVHAERVVDGSGQR